MKTGTDVVIVGGGMVGLVLAGLLAKVDRLNVCVIDAGERESFSLKDEVGLRVSAISPGSVELLKSIGVWEHIAAQRLCAYDEMKVWDEAASLEGPTTLSFAAAEFALPQLGYIVENALIKHALLAYLSDANVAVQFATEIDGVKDVGDRFEVQLVSGNKLTPDLLIGADGARSFVRGSIGIAIKSWQHGQKAFVTHLSPEFQHKNTAWQRFLRTGPIGLLPLHDGRLSTVWSTTPKAADDAMQMSDQQLASRLTEVTDGALGRLVPAGPRGVFPLQSQHAVNYVMPGVALVGDAAHAIHPLAGQGVNLGFADAATLANVIQKEMDAGENIGDLPALRKYERARTGANQTMLAFLDGLNRLFSNNSAPLGRLRGLGMVAFNKSGPLRSHVVRTALGIQ